MVKKQDRVGVVQLLDKLAVGGMERIAVDVANHLPEERYRSYVCTTRRDGPLRTDLAPHVGYTCLRRKHRFDPVALNELRAFVQHHQISIIHAHSSALFVASVMSLLPPFPKIVWHCHSGWSGKDLPVLPYLAMVRSAKATIAVNDLIRKRILHNLRYPAHRIWYVPNFSSLPEHHFTQDAPAADLPGMPGNRIVCVAGLWGRKDQLTLIRAMSAVRSEVSDAHLLLVGGEWDELYVDRLRRETRDLDLKENVTFLGVRRDIAAILRACDIGVLSSVSEGLPVAVLEYGRAGLGVVCTRVGQCAEVLDEGRAGLLVPPEDSSAMASALISLLLDTSQRRLLGKRLQDRVRSHYSLEQAIAMIDSIYKVVEGESGVRE